MAERDHPPVEGWTPPTAKQRYDLLQRTKTVAMVGVSAKTSRPSNFVATYLLGYPDSFEVYFVNPRATTILGRPVYPTLADLPVIPDLVDVFRKPADLPSVAEEAVAIGTKALWVQLGLWSADAAKIAVDAGLEVVMDRCIKIEHARFYGGLHLAGFNTGEIRSKRARRPR
ncbi:MAG: CoA-binding protein [Myxococcota bacterium]